MLLFIISNSWVWLVSCFIAYVIIFQTIISAMSTLTPPVSIANPSNQPRAEYIKSIAPLSDFDYTEVRHLILIFYGVKHKTSLNHVTSLDRNLELLLSKVD